MSSGRVPPLVEIGLVLYELCYRWMGLVFVECVVVVDGKAVISFFFLFGPQFCFLLITYSVYVGVNTRVS